MNNDGSLVNYNDIKKSDNFQQYILLIQKLHNININDFNNNEKKSIYINIYNCLILHAIINGLLDINGGTISRLKLYATASYNIGGIIYSLNDIENGLLRNNRKSAVPFTHIPFKDNNDIRRLYCIDKCDGRIHFALNCGAISCPSISIYNDNDINDQLDLATEVFLDQSVILDSITKTITLSMLFKWYREDFGNTDQDVLNWIKNHSSENLYQKIVAFENNINNDKFTIKYAPYDWSLNELL
jgi:hypothetical protein